jgi:NAD+ kinase
MKIKIFGLERDNLAKYIKKNYPHFRILSQKEKIKPDFVLCYGGDGTLLMSERENPGVPKVSIRNSQICNTCRWETRDAVLRLLEQNKFYIKKHNKIEAIFKNKHTHALNDIIIGHRNINTALRFKVYINDHQYGTEFLGDGVVAATPIGSTAYYQVITRSNFEEGIGLAFNNTINSIGHVVIDDDNIIKVVVTRGPGCLRFDNYKEHYDLKEGDEVTIKKSKEIAQIVNFRGAWNKLNVSISQNRLPLGYCQVCRKYYWDK